MSKSLWHVGVLVVFLGLGATSRGEVRLLTDEEMKTASGSGLCQECKGQGSCPTTTGCGAVTCIRNFTQNPFCPSGFSWWCSASGGRTGCTNDAKYKTCVWTFAFYCDGNASGTTPCGQKQQPKCVKFADTFCAWPDSSCFCLIQGGTCHRSNCK